MIRHRTVRHRAVQQGVAALGLTLGLALLTGGGSASAVGFAESTGPLIDPDAAEELAVTLAEAREAQGVCYGWEVVVDDRSGSDTGTYEGSDRGVGLPVDTTCADWAVLQVGIVYTSFSSEAEDSAFWQVSSSPSLSEVTTDDIEGLGISRSGLLSDTASEDVLVSAVSTLPVLAAEAGVAPPVPLETSSEPLPQGAAPDAGGGGSDWLRARGAELVLLVLIALGGLVALALSFPRARRAATGAVDTLQRHT